MIVKRIGVQAALIGALAATAVGVGSGVANAEQPVPNAPGMTWKLDKWDDWDDRGRGPRWDSPAYWNGPQYGGPCAWVPPAVSMWVPPAAC
ncbi:hypothetical protein A5765_22290 [Mycolicibacterium celeriflavum]|uniref:hypothetical protein n=1 Tax=Mycolicibacterium celeriflavum TaxID=1249101 RepID=UPI0007FEC809|nr:hypothetical protein [Mycolicibacterium celeriflavum]OBG20837.1 hypothetical protein A5765_22290 [Mycolicibacterium celeriflavum]